MSMYTVCGRVFVTRDELYHGLGKGSGRGRPKGSRNGYIDPRAAYMKGYEIQGQKANDTTRNPNSNQRAVGSGGSGGLVAANTRTRDRRVVSDSPSRTTRTAASASRTKAPIGNGAAAYTARGKEIIDNINRQASTEPTTTSAEPQPLKESVWDRIGKAFGTVAEKVKSTAARAIDMGKRAYNSAKNWVKKAVGEAGKFAKTAYSAAAKFVGDRVRDLDRWWNGYDKPTGSNGTREHVNGFKENAQQAVSDAGKAVSNAAQQVGNWANENVAQPIGTAAQQVGDWVQGNVINPTTSAAQQAGNWINENVVSPTVSGINSAGEWIDNNVLIPAGETVNNLGVRAQEFVTNGIPAAYGQAVQGVNNGIGQLDRWANGYEEQDERYAGRTYRVPGAIENVGNTVNSAVQQVGDWANQGAQAVGNAARQASGWANQNVVQPAGALWNQGVQAVTEAVSPSITGLTQRAIGRGVDPAAVQRAIEQYNYGLITEDVLRNWLTNAK